MPGFRKSKGQDYLQLIPPLILQSRLYDITLSSSTSNLFSQKVHLVIVPTVDLYVGAPADEYENKLK